MSIATAIQATQQKVANAYTAVSNKGGTLPATKNLANLPAAINSISSGTTPTGTISITSNGTYDVTNYASADVNVPGGGSKYGVTIDDLLGDVNASGNLLEPTKPASIEFTGVKTISTNYALMYVFYGQTLPAVSFPDLTSVSGNYSLFHAFDGYSAANNRGAQSVSFPKLQTIGGTQALSYAFNYSKVTSVEFPELTSISGTYGLFYAFDNSTSLTSASFPKLTSVAQYGLGNTFYKCSKLTSVSFPVLATLTGTYSMSQTFNGSSLVTVEFPALTSLTGSQAMGNCFNSCTKLTDVYFPALTTSSFGTTKNQFINLLASTGTTVTHTLHFPSNMESVISTLTGYPAFSGTASAVKILYDLPATS